MVRYEILGPLRVVEGGQSSYISARKVETVLAVLLIRSDRVVAFDRLMAEIWGACPPRRAAAALHVYVSQLRKFLDRPGRAESPVITHAPGYLLRIGDDEVDSLEFLDLINEGRESVNRGQNEYAAVCFEKALGMWRGPVLEDLRGGAVIDSFVNWLMELRLECQEMLTDVHLGLGRHREIIGHLYSLAAENPFREAFHRQLMLALYRSDRQADALEVYQAARRTLNEELGLEPCRALRDLHRAILVNDRQLDLCSASS